MYSKFVYHCAAPPTGKSATRVVLFFSFMDGRPDSETTIPPNNLKEEVTASSARTCPAGVRREGGRVYLPGVKQKIQDAVTNTEVVNHICLYQIDQDLC